MTVEQFLQRWIGTPYIESGRDIHGLDCWGLVKEYYSQVLDILLPSYVGQYTVQEKEETAFLISQEAKSLWDRVDIPRSNDLILLNILGHPVHVGIFQKPDKILHTRRGANACIEPIHKWRNRVEGYYRWHKFM